MQKQVSRKQMTSDQLGTRLTEICLEAMGKTDKQKLLDEMHEIQAVLRERRLEVTA
jgi:hypothetical protein